MLDLQGVSRRFGATLAVDRVSLAVPAGEIVGLVGENGAGKSTLMRIVAGEIEADEGRVGRPERVGMVHQHFALVAELTIAENLALLDPAMFRFTSRRTMERESERIVARCGIDLTDVRRRAADLAVGEKSKLELIKAISVGPQLLVLDEPTSVLAPPEAAELFAVIRRLAADGTAVVFISHKVPEVLEIAHRIVVMRHGRIVADAPRPEMTGQSIAAAMVDADVVRPAPPAGTAPPGAPLLHVSGLSGVILREVTLAIHRHETVAVVGVAGNGQSELARLLRGIGRPASGSLQFHSERVAFIPEDRTTEALIAEMTIAENVALGSNAWSPGPAAERAIRLIERFRIRATGPQQRAGSLSGGNQQKVVLARELERRPDLIIAAEPTRGLDIEATSFVHEELRTAVAGGAGLLLITSDLDEAFALGDAVHVLYRGTLTERLDPGDAAVSVGALMAGVR